MLNLIFHKGDSFVFDKKKLASSGGAPQENELTDTKFRFANPQGIGQFHDN